MIASKISISTKRILLNTLEKDGIESLEFIKRQRTQQPDSNKAINDQFERRFVAVLPLDQLKQLSEDKDYVPPGMQLVSKVAGM